MQIVQNIQFIFISVLTFDVCFAFNCCETTSLALSRNGFCF